MEIAKTIKKRINWAFKKLRDAGYYAKQKYWCCQSCAWTDVPDDEEKVVFYHEQDADHINKDGSLDRYGLWLAWRGNAKEIIDILKSCDLTVEAHDGSEYTRIHILPELETS